jgi:hypothetical protein
MYRIIYLPHADSTHKDAVILPHIYADKRAAALAATTLTILNRDAWSAQIVFVKPSGAMVVAGFVSRSPLD